MKTGTPDWAEQVAGDPEGSFQRLAESRGMTVEELKARHQKIASLTPAQLDEVLTNAGVDVSTLFNR